MSIHRCVRHLSGDQAFGLRSANAYCACNCSRGFFCRKGIVQDARAIRTAARRECIVGWQDSSVRWCFECDAKKIQRYIGPVPQRECDDAPIGLAANPLNICLDRRLGQIGRSHGECQLALGNHRGPDASHCCNERSYKRSNRNPVHRILPPGVHQTTASALLQVGGAA